MRKNLLIAVGYEKLLTLVQENAPVDQRRDLIRDMREHGLALPDAVIGSTLVTNAEALQRPGAILIGSIAFETYCGMRGLIDLPPELVSTKDIDIACQLRGLADGPPPKQSAANDYIRDAGPDNVKIDFVTPQTPREEEKGNARPFVYAPTLDSYAMVIPGFVRLMLKNPVDAVIAYGSGIKTQVPDPLRFAMRKTQLASVRPDPAKARKDLGQAALLFNEFCDDRQSHAGIAAEFFAYRNEMLGPSLADGLQEIMPRLSGNAQKWLASGYAQSRPAA